MLREYIEGLKSTVQRLEDEGFADSVKPIYDERKNHTALVSIQVILIDRSELYIREFIHGREAIKKESYSYQYQAMNKTLIFRYDNSQHKPALGCDDHKHQQDGSIIPCQMPNLNQIIDEVIDYITQSG